MAAITIEYEITNAGGTVTIDPQGWGGGNAVVYLFTTGAVTLAADVIVSVTSNFNQGNSLLVIQSASNITRNGKKLQIVLPTGGYDYTDDWQFLTSSTYQVINVDGTNYSSAALWDLATGNGVSGATALSDASLTLAKFPAQTRGYIWAGDATGRPALLNAKTNAQILIGDGTDLVSVPVTGDIAITNAGVTSIGAGVIVNADINAAAAIAFSKLAALSSGNLLVGSAGNVATSVAMSGDVTISNTGVTAIGASKVTNTMMADDSVTLTNLASTGQVYSNATTVATGANTTETTLASFAVGSAIGDADGDVLEVYAYGSFGATANNKSVRLRFGATLATATQLCINTTTAAPNGINWCIRTKLFRTGAASQKGQAEILFSGIAAELDNYTATETWSTSTIFVSGQNGTAAANDIILEGFEVKIARTNNN